MDKAVILAAGLAKRMGEPETPKGLIKIAGREILYRNMKILENLGVKEFIIITNTKYYKKFEEFLKKYNFKGKVVINKEPERENGYSLYLAKDYVKEPFILMMSDHIYGEDFLKEAIKGEGLVADREPRYIDVEEATKVKVLNNRVKDIGKHLKEFDAVDTGFFILTPEIFKTIEKINKEKITLSEVMKEAEVKVHFVDGKFWTDVDTPEEIKRAKWLLIKNSIKGTGDGFISRYINRKISTRISYFLVDHLTPNQMTVISFILGILSALLCFISIPLGGIFYQISSIVDGVDGEIARASMRTSKLGGYIDSILDRYVDFFFLLVLAYLTISSTLMWVIACLAIFGSVMVSYSTERYKAAFGRDIYKDIKEMKYLIGKRDERVFLTMILCLLQKVELLFIILAIITNIRVILTLYLVCKKVRE
ncbi:bifunctional L-myo-inositol-1-phosphate cytidylyltransferase/CDP-L-myo-inositol myo-inositolphosphotransferase [Methanocaldococcus infernus]